jgi:alkylation response protein AidB-like acyl-CoA dehydrogenase
LTAQRAAESSDPTDMVRLPTLSKLGQVRIMKLATRIGMDILGPEGLLWPPDGPRAGRYALGFATSPSFSIGGGTDQIHRNIVAERALGLPRDPDSSRQGPYRAVLQQIGHVAGDADDGR